MEGILFEDQLYSTPKSQSYYSRNNTTTCRPNDLIMISNHQGSYLFASCGQNESPIFKVRDSRGEYGQIQLRLTVMEVIYPNDLFNSQNNRANILRAIREGLAVVKESDSVITFTVNRNQRIEPIDLQEIDYVSPVQVNSPVCISGNCEEGIRGCVKVEGKCSNRYAFFLTRRPKNGIVKLNEKTGEWTYQTAESCCDSDTFEITVWNFAGGCASQCIHINCEQEQGPFDVNIINTPLPVIVGNPVPVFGDVRVINSPTVIIEQPIEVVTGITPLSVTFPGVIDVSIVNLDLSVIVETIVIDQVVDVNILTIPEITIAELPAVELSGTPTVVLDQIVEVSVVNPLTIASLPEVTVASLPPVELSGTPTVALDQIVEVSVVNPLTIASLPEVTVVSLPAVELSGTPTVVLDQIVEVSVVNPLTIASIPEVTVVSLPAVELSGTPTVALDQIVGVSVVTPLTIASLPEVTVASLPAVELSGTPTVALDQIVGVSVVTPLTIASLPEVTVASLPAVELSGTPTVALDQIVGVSVVSPLTIPGVVTVTVAQPIEVIIVTTLSNLNVNSYNFYETSLTTLNVPSASTNLVIYDASSSSDQTLFAHFVSGLSVIGQPIVSPILDEDYFTPAGEAQELDATSPNYPFVSNYVGRYVGIEFSNDTATDATVEVIAQSEGPITEA